MWMAFIQMAQQAISGYGKQEVQNAVNDATGVINDANTYADNLASTTNATAANEQRTAMNGFQAAQAALSNTQRSIGNNNRMDAIGNQFNAQQTNEARTMDQMVKGNIEQQIQGASTLGALRASAASRGVGGTSAAIMRSTMQQTLSRQQVNTTEKMGSFQFDALLKNSGLMRNMVMSQDMGESLGNLDYGVNIATLTQSPIKTPDTDPSTAALLGAGGGIGSLAMLGGSVGGFGASSTGPVGNSPGYSSNAIINGVSTVNSMGYSAGYSSGDSNSTGYDFSSLGGKTNGFFSTGGGNNSFNFQLS